MELPLYQVDAFTDRLFAGNPAAVMPLERWLPDEQMQRIAKAIADPQRFAILACIAKTDEIPCKQLVSEFPITQATIRITAIRISTKIVIVPIERDASGARAAPISPPPQPIIAQPVNATK